MIPVFVVELDETHTALSQSAGEQTITGERTVAGLATVKFEHLRSLAGKVHQFRHARLHLVRHFVLSNASSDFWIIDDRFVLMIECINRRDVASLLSAQIGRASCRDRVVIWGYVGA